MRHITVFNGIYIYRYSERAREVEGESECSKGISSGSGMCKRFQLPLCALQIFEIDEMLVILVAAAVAVVLFLSWVN